MSLSKVLLINQLYGLYRYNCTHKNESYCQYTFLYKEDPSLGVMDLVMDMSSVLCPVIVKPDYLGWALGKQ